MVHARLSDYDYAEAAREPRPVVATMIDALADPFATAEELDFSTAALESDDDFRAFLADMGFGG